ncbi:MAG: helix-turn-helix transcriptional regulator [Ruminococcus sp.]|nr:helix-turn-helix transcriptional regulator [Ruminococcus sp.]
MKKSNPAFKYALYIIVWSNIRKFQYINGISEEQLAEMLKVTTRTLYAYDKDPSCITLEKLQQFVEQTGIEAAELIAK